nr:phosphotransferase [Arthrobacter antioxidans]
MDVRSVPREASAFQQPLSEEELRAICDRAFPDRPRIIAAQELLGGRYNTTYRLDRHDVPSLILRVAPELGRQSRLEHRLMRTEYASLPLLAAVGHLMPTVIRADFTGTIIDRDYLIQSYLPGVPAAQALKQYTTAQQLDFWFQLGEILAAIHAQTGERFGPIRGVQYESWSASLTATFQAIAADMTDAALDASDIAEILQVIKAHASSIDEDTVPRLLHGDLWIGNVMLAADSATPRIVGIYDCDRTSWGDTESDWTLFLLQSRPPEVQQAFRRGYRRTPQTTPAATLRALIYRARSIAEARLEYRRLGEDQHLASTYSELGAVLAELN